MANYKESTLGTAGEYTRCSYVEINNTLNTTPKVIFREQKNIVVDNNSLTQLDAGAFVKKLNDFTETIDILDPETNLSTGTTITYQELYNYIYSAYIQNAVARDTHLAANGGELVGMEKVTGIVLE